MLKAHFLFLLIAQNQSLYVMENSHVVWTTHVATFWMPFFGFGVFLCFFFFVDVCVLWSPNRHKWIYVQIVLINYVFTILVCSVVYSLDLINFSWFTGLYLILGEGVLWAICIEDSFLSASCSLLIKSTQARCGSMS